MLSHCWLDDGKTVSIIYTDSRPTKCMKKVKERLFDPDSREKRPFEGVRYSSPNAVEEA